MEDYRTGDVMNNNHNSGIITKIIGWSLSGNSRSDLIDLIKIHSPVQVTNAECDSLIKQSKEVLEKSVTIDAEQAVTIHVDLYENIFKYFNTVLHTGGMTKSLAAKEKLLGITGGNKITINKKTEVNIKRKQAEYDEERLSLIQRDRWRILIEKMKI